MDLYLKDPEAVISYAIDWGGAYLGPLAIAASAWEISPDENGGLVLASHHHDLRSTSAEVSGGVAGHVYRLANRVTLSDGSSDVRSIALRVEER
jgi:hypothetical protein